MHNPGKVLIREADLDDASLMFSWRNDPAARVWFHDQEPLQWDSHLAWLSRRLQTRQPTLWIGEQNGVAVGCVRIDVGEDGSGLVSIVVDSQARRLGVGTHLIAWADAQAKLLGCTAVIAEVHPENLASQALFFRAGYRPQTTSNAGFTLYTKSLGSEG